MVSSTINLQCPNCGAPLVFDSGSGMLICGHCRSSFEPKSFGSEPEAEGVSSRAAARRAQAKARRWSEEEAAGLKTYACSTCGAELVCGEETAATKCPYCGSPTILGDRLANELKPEYILPFKLDKAKAIEQLNKFYKGKLLLPRAFKDKNHIQEIKGVYVPFWLYDARAGVSGRYKGEISETHRRGDYNVTTTRHYNVKRDGTEEFVRVPVDASSKMPDGHMDAIEPFDYSALENFSVSYLPGFMADRYDQNKGECAKRAKARISSTAENALHATLEDYTAYDTVEENITVDVQSAHYALLPVWLLHTKWNGKDFLFAMNGQTGRLVGELPIDKAKLAAWFAGVLVSLTVIFRLVLF